MVPLSRPLFDGFGLDVNSQQGSSAGVTTTAEAPIEDQVPKAKTTSKKLSHVVIERLPNGWRKKAVKRLSGVAKGRSLWPFLEKFIQKVIEWKYQLKMNPNRLIRH